MSTAGRVKLLDQQGQQGVRGSEICVDPIRCTSRAFRKVTTKLAKMYSVVGALLLLEFLAQFYTIASSGFITVANEIANAGVGSVAPQEIEPFSAAHAVNGVFIVPLTIVALIGLSFGARHPRRTTVLAAVLFLLWVIQFALAFVGFLGVAPLAGLHGVNALAMVGLGIYLVKRHWAFGRHAPAQTQADSSLTG